MMDSFLSFLNDLGYSRVVSILDGDKKDLSESLQEKYGCYKILCIPTNDVRDKKDDVKGLVNKKGELKAEYRELVKKMFLDIDLYFTNTV